MKINIIKKHSTYPLGDADVDEKRAAYLLRTGVAESVERDWFSKDQNEPEKEEILTKEDVKEKQEVKAIKGKQEIKTKAPIQRKKK